MPAITLGANDISQIQAPILGTLYSLSLNVRKPRRNDPARRPLAPER